MRHGQLPADLHRPHAFQKHGLYIVPLAAHRIPVQLLPVLPFLFVPAFLFTKTVITTEIPEAAAGANLVRPAFRCDDKIFSADRANLLVCPCSVNLCHAMPTFLSICSEHHPSFLRRNNSAVRNSEPQPSSRMLSAVRLPICVD